MRKAHGKYAENRGKWVENHSISFLFIPQPLAWWPVSAVVFGRFQSFSVVFAVIFGENQKISEKNREFSGIFTEIIPFHSFSFLNTPILCSTTCFWNYFERGMKISRFFFGGSKYSSYFCQRLTDDCRQSGGATVSPMAFSRRLFLCLGKSFFLTGKIDMPNTWRLHEP